jgi:UDP-N-acetylglucosamine acyltransferase
MADVFQGCFQRPVVQGAVVPRKTALIDEPMLDDEVSIEWNCTSPYLPRNGSLFNMAAAAIHSTAIVSTDVTLAEGVSIGPYSVLEGPIVLGAGCQVGPHVQMLGRVTAGANNRFHSGCVIGDTPQHLGYQGEATEVRIGTGNTFREHVTVHRGMPANGGVTTIGNGNLFMVGSHIAHDCHVGDQAIFANCAVIGGHATVMDRAFLSGNSCVHQFCRVGRLAMISGTSSISQDLPPFWIVQEINITHGVNVVGMRRAGIPNAEIQAVRRAYTAITRSGLTIRAALDQIELADGEIPAVRELIDFIRESKRGICTGTVRGGIDD